MKTSPTPSSALLPPPFGSLCPGARPDLLRLPLWCGGLAGAFRFFLRVLGAKWGLMLGWVVGGRGLE
ncbi:MAG: hypothetical protein P1P72_11255, partial [ANME-2 cluster archaeon]|nr:hypothetical protein [ANME-2 cluster archaeon]